MPVLYASFSRQYSRVLSLMPGSGTGYFPSGTARRGEGPSSVNVFDAWCELMIVIHHLVERDQLACVRGKAAHRRHQARFRLRFTSLYGLSARIAAIRSFHSPVIIG